MEPEYTPTLREYLDIALGIATLGSLFYVLLVITPT
jgi:hypothetical protein